MKFNREHLEELTLQKIKEVNMTKDSITKVRYLHKLTEDVDVTLKAGITLHNLCSPDKLNQYSAWNGTSFFSYTFR